MQRPPPLNERLTVEVAIRPKRLESNTIQQSTMAAPSKNNYFARLLHEGRRLDDSKLEEERADDSKERMGDSCSRVKRHKRDDVVRFPIPSKREQLLGGGIGSVSETTSCPACDTKYRTFNFSVCPDCKTVNPLLLSISEQ